MAQCRTLMALRQQGMEVGGFSQILWSLALGLEYNDGALKDFFNACLDDPRSHWEMEGLGLLDFWGFARYLHWRSQWATPGQPETFRRDFPTSPGLPTPMEKQRTRRRRAAKTPPVVLEDPTPVVPSPAVLEDPTPLVPSPVVLKDPTPLVPSTVALEEPTSVVPSPVVLTPVHS